MDQGIRPTEPSAGTMGRVLRLFLVLSTVLVAAPGAGAGTGSMPEACAAAPMDATPADGAATLSDGVPVRRETGWPGAAGEINLAAASDATAGAGSPAESGSSDTALRLARRTLDAMGGAEAFARLRTLRFDFVVERDGREVVRRSHVWDRHDGRYRVSGTDRDGKGFVVLFDVSDPAKGRAWIDGREIEGDDLAGRLKSAYGYFINDTYWLLMPAKMLDPGVHLAYEGEGTEQGKLYDLVRLTFDHVGLTPGDTYRAWIARETGLMERWDFVLEGQEPGDRSTFLWTDWRPVAGVKLAALRTGTDGKTVIRFEPLEGSDGPDDAVFVPPSGP